MWCTLDGHPPVQILAPLNVGARFHVYRALLGADEVVIKTPSPIAAREGLYRQQDLSYVDPTNIFRSGSVAPCEASAGLLGRLLALEQAAIDRSEGRWNHSTLGLSHWLGPDGGPGLPALLLPLHDAEPLARFERHERVDLIERMLVSLWSALADCPHGDLNEANLLIARDRSRFHIIDPGVREVSEVQVAESAYATRTDKLTTFTTTPACYPILSPCEPGHGVSLVEELAELSRGWRFGLGDLVAPRDPLQRPAGRPWSPDLLAIGILYARALTGEEPFLGTLLERPSWLGDLPVRQDFGLVAPNDVLLAWERVRDTVAGHIDRLLDRREISEPRRELARALLSLEIADAAALRALLRL